MKEKRKTEDRKYGLRILRSEGFFLQFWEMVCGEEEWFTSIT